MNIDSRTGYADLNGLQMYYEIHGSGPPLVLLHGAFGTADGWMALLPKLGANRQLIILEQQGHGHTADRNTPLTYEQMAEDTAALLNDLSLNEVDIYALGCALRPS